MQINKTYFDKLDLLGKAKTPFLFIIDFEQKKPLVFPLNEIPDQIYFKTPRFCSDLPPKSKFPSDLFFNKKTVPIERYKNAFNLVMDHINYGDSYLLNLTMPTKIDSNLSLINIFEKSNSIFRLYYKNEFVCFSPEIFVNITDGKILSYPMKGTIDASIPDAETKLLQSKKEIAEHNTIVDLIRNDLSIISKNVRVKRFRYIDQIKTHTKTLLQVSSEIEGELDEDYESQIGSLLSKLLPAGSISGAPKDKTVEIILKAEQYDRSYYTGIFGIFDGRNLDSSVMIRFLENNNGDLVFKSGGGITAMSNLNEEFQELKDKVYIPFD